MNQSDRITSSFRPPRLYYSCRILLTSVQLILSPFVLSLILIPFLCADHFYHSRPFVPLPPSFDNPPLGEAAVSDIPSLL